MEKVIEQLKAISDKTRLRIIFLLMEGELCVCEIENILNMEQSRISHALSVLKKVSFVEERKEGRWAFYSISSSFPEYLLQYLKNVKVKSDEVKKDYKKLLKIIRFSKKERKRCPLKEGI